MRTLKGQAGPLAAILPAFVIPIALILGIIIFSNMDETLSQQTIFLKQVTNEGALLNTLSAVSLNEGNIVSGSDTVRNYSNPSQTFTRNTDYVLTLGSSDTVGTIRWLNNVTVNSTNTTAVQVLALGVANHTFQPNNGTAFTSQNNRLIINLWNATAGGPSGPAAIRVSFNGNILGNATLGGAGTLTQFIYPNVTGSMITTGTPIVILTSNTTNGGWAINSSQLVYGDGARVNVTYQYYGDSQASTTLGTIATNTYSGFDLGSILPIVLFGVAVLAVVVGAFVFGRGG